MATTRPEPRNEALAAATDQIGDRWVLRVIDALAAGPLTFNDLQGATGVATNVLSARLKGLEADGVVAAEPYQQRPLRYAYRLTDIGRQLLGALRVLTDWGQARLDGSSQGPAHDVCGTPLEVRWYCSTCAEVVEHDHQHEARL